MAPNRSLFVIRPPGSERLISVFRNRRDAVIRGERDERVLQADQLVDALQQLADHAIGAHGDVADLR